MLDLAFVRTNLPLVEEKLRARGADPVAILGDFQALDQARRAAITEVETLRASQKKISCCLRRIRAIRPRRQISPEVMCIPKPARHFAAPRLRISI